MPRLRFAVDGRAGGSKKREYVRANGRARLYHAGQKREKCTADQKRSSEDTQVSMTSYGCPNSNNIRQVSVPFQMRSPNLLLSCFTRQASRHHTHPTRTTYARIRLQTLCFAQQTWRNGARWALLVLLYLEERGSSPATIFGSLFSSLSLPARHPLTERGCRRGAGNRAHRIEGERRRESVDDLDDGEVEVRKSDSLGRRRGGLARGEQGPLAAIRDQASPAQVEEETTTTRTATARTASQKDRVRAPAATTAGKRKSFGPGWARRRTT